MGIMEDMREKWWLVVQRGIALVGLVGLLPVTGVIAWLIKREDGGPVFFKQERWGKGRRPFVMWKFRTMKVGAEEEKEKLLALNEADGPVFKIRNDPRFTRVGRWLSRVGLDELPQLWNVVRGEMALVGPRPLPAEEARKVPKKYWRRYEAWGWADLGATLSCRRDAAFIEGFNPCLRFERQHTPMEGHAFCDFCYRVEADEAA